MQEAIPIRRCIPCVDRPSELIKLPRYTNRSTASTVNHWPACKLKTAVCRGQYSESSFSVMMCVVPWSLQQHQNGQYLWPFGRAVGEQNTIIGTGLIRKASRTNCDMHQWTLCIILPRIQSMAIQNNAGANTQPWRTPEVVSNGSDNCPFARTRDLVLWCTGPPAAGPGWKNVGLSTVLSGLLNQRQLQGLHRAYATCWWQV